MGTSGQVSELQERYEKLVDKQARQRKDYEALICKLDETEQELAAARYRPPTTQVEVQTDHVEPDIVLVEQPPSQATLSAIAESVRAELVHLTSLHPPFFCLRDLFACLHLYCLALGSHSDQRKGCRTITSKNSKSASLTWSAEMKCT